MRCAAGDLTIEVSDLWSSTAVANLVPEQPVRSDRVLSANRYEFTRRELKYAPDASSVASQVRARLTLRSAFSRIALPAGSNSRDMVSKLDFGGVID